MKPVHHCCTPEFPHDHGRRNWLKASVSVGAVMAAGVSFLPAIAHALALSQKQRDAMTPDQVIEILREGNARFRSGNMKSHDFLAQKKATATGQYPGAVILNCIDSRTPAEIIFDARIGDVFGARVAGNISTPNLLGSMEYACAVAGAKLVLVLGHTGCGAITGAINGVQLGNLTGLLEQIVPAVDATQFAGERSARNPDFVNAVAQTNVLHTVQTIRKNSPVLADLEKQGKILIRGAMYDLNSGAVDFLG